MKREKITRAMDYLDENLIAGAEESKNKKTYQSGGYNMKKVNVWKKWAAAAAAFAIIFTVVVVMAQFIGGGNSVIALDVNPSIEIEVNKDEKIEKVTALNEDAKTVIGEMDLKDVNLDVAINAIIGSMLKNGFLSINQNSILISVDGKNQETEAKLQKLVSESVSALLETEAIDASVLTQSYNANNKNNDAEISVAKAAFIEKIIAIGLKNAQGVAYTYEELASLNVNELKLILESKDVKPEGVEFSGYASEGKYVGHETALETALARAGIARTDASRISVELDYEDDYRKMLYEVNFVYGNFEYEYEIDAETGVVIKAEKEIKDLFEDNDKEDVVPPGCISHEEAIAIALQHAGLTREEALDLDCEFESGIFGRKIFEVDFEAAGIEYEYKINAKNGEIIRANSERD